MPATDQTLHSRYADQRFTVGSIDAVAGAWTFSDAHSDPETARRYYADVHQVPVERVYVKRYRD
jgi:hypothetical protein